MRAALRLVEGLDELCRPDGRPFEARAGVMTGELLVAHDVDPALGERLRGRRRRQHGRAARGVGAAGHRGRRRADAPAHRGPVQLRAPRPRSRSRASRARWRAGGRSTRSPGSATTRIGGSLSPLVGRDSEVAFLTSLLRRVIETHAPQVALIIGDPGIGKSRLVRELFAVVDTGRELITWRYGRCASYGEDRTFWALREVVQAHAGILETHDPETVAELLERAVEDGPDHRRLCERLRPLVGLDAPDAEPEENYAAWLQFLRQVGGSSPAGPGPRGPALGGRGVAGVRRLRGGQRLRPPAAAGGDGAAGGVRAAPGVRRVGRPRDQDLARPPVRRGDQALVSSLPEMDGTGRATVDLVARRAGGQSVLRRGAGPAVEGQRRRRRRRRCRSPSRR